MQSLWPDNVPKSTSPLRFLWASSQPYRGWMIAAVIMVTLASVTSMAIPYAFKTIVDAAARASYDELTWAVIAYVGISFGSNLLYRASGLTGMRWITGVRASSRYMLTSYVTRHSHQYFADRFAGALSSKIIHAANGAKDIADQFLWSFFGFVVSMIAGFVIVFRVNPTVAYIFLAWITVITPLNIVLSRKRVPISAATQKAETALGGATVDMLTNMAAVEEYTHHSFELERIKKFIIDRRATGLRNWTYGEFVLTINNFLQAVFIGGMILSVIALARLGSITPGDIILILTVVVFMEDRLTFIGSKFNSFADTWGTVEESLADIILEHTVTDKSDAKDLAIRKGEIVFDDISFDYGGAHVFEKLSFIIPAGQKVGLVGRSGAGKSTLVKLLLRHYDLHSGAINIDGINISDITKESLRRAIAIVPQEPMLFHRSIRHNIEYGKDDATMEEVERAARQAEAHEFIGAIPQGYEALVGERGVKLSGGQRQRVAIARVFVKDAPILLLDEATSSLDSESEVAVQKALLNLMKGRTVIAIAHRLSTLRAMDRLIVLDQGKIVEDGTHDQLVKKKGLYAALWEHQAGGFLPEED
ncbi:MAG: ABC transporter ATP-binding protein [Patescibacteria group bacterium]